MNDNFTEVNPDSLTMNPFTKIGKQWMLITAGDSDSWNTMTASWGGLGVLWHRNVSFAFVRYSRFTYEFMEKHSTFTLSFFPESERSKLSYCGSYSGRDVNKAEETGLVPFSPDSNAVSFEQAELVLVCRKIHAGAVRPEDFIDPTINDNYKTKDYHEMYVGEIVKVLERK